MIIALPANPQTLETLTQILYAPNSSLHCLSPLLFYNPCINALYLYLTFTTLTTLEGQKLNPKP